MTAPGSLGTTNVEKRIVNGFRELKSAKLPDIAISAAEMVVLDWLGCLLVGSEAPPALAVAAAHSLEIGSGPATCFVGPTLCNLGLAALISGTASHTPELDDIFSPAIYHPGVCVISAALAASQFADVRGDCFLRAVIAGYEISNRIGTGVNPAHYRYWHTTGTIGTIGATIAAAIILDLSPKQLAHAIGHAGSMAAGLVQAFSGDGMTKPFHAGRAAEAGLLAARVAKHGLTGSKAILSGPAGLVQAMSDGKDIAGVFDDLFAEWTIAATTCKRFSSCGHTFAPADITDDLKRQFLIDPLQVDTIQVVTYAVAAKVAGISNPKSPFEAKFSIQFVVAATLLGYDLTAPLTFETHYDEDEIHRLAAKISVATDDAFSAVFPRLRGARVAITLKDGRTHTGSASSRKGDPENPFSRDEIEMKFRRLCEMTRHAELADAWVKWVGSLAGGGSLAPNALPSSLLL